MKRAPMLLVALLATFGCHDVAPKITAPPSTGTSKAFVWAMVIDQDGRCISGARLTVIRGQDSGTVVTPDSDCDVWSYSGGYTFTNLTPLVPMTLRASAAGFADNEKTISPEAHAQSAFLFAMSPR